MKRFQLKRTRSLVSARKRIPLYATAAVFLALVVFLSVALVSRNGLSRKIAANRENLAISVQSNINALARSYERMGLPGADVSGELLPSMRLNLNTAEAMNDLLVDSYGAQYAVLSDELFRQLNDNLASLGDTLDKGQMITDVQTAIGATLSEVEKQLVARFGSDGGLMPVSAST